MLVQTSQGQSGSAHVVVLGNEKGGSGKSTTALHVAVALLKAGQRVATIDLDCRQQSFTHYIDNRRAWARRTGLDLELPVHRCIKLGETMQILDNESSELVQFVDAVSAVERAFDFIVIDTPGSDTYLMRLAHAMADTLVTPINDSFLDFDVLGTVDPATYSVTGESHYAEVVRDARRKRRQLDGASSDWIVVRNRLSMVESRNKQLVADSLNELSLRLGFRSIDGFTQREVYREFYPRGLTALDDLDEALGTHQRREHVMAREEVTRLLRQLKLPIDERGRRRAANRAEWFNQVNKPLEVHDIFGAPQIGFQTIIAERDAEVWVRRYNGVPECDVIVAVRGQEMALRCRDYSEAVKWAGIECKSYKVDGGFTVERAATADGRRGHRALSRGYAGDRGMGSTFVTTQPCGMNQQRAYAS